MVLEKPGFFFYPPLQNLLSQSDFVDDKVIFKAELVFEALQSFENKGLNINRSCVRSYTLDAE